MAEQANFGFDELRRVYNGVSFDGVATYAGNSHLGVLIYGVGYRRVEDMQSPLLQDDETFTRRFLDDYEYIREDTQP